ncbi:MAG: CUAEP/CCAEP-tail radical SAM protein [Vicinamibacterales bacterium]
MNVLLISTYDLGRQPFGLASPAAWLRRAGHDVDAIDLSRGQWSKDAVAGAQLIAFYLPMHTATRLAMPVIDRVRALHPATLLCAYGLYAPLNADLLRQHGIHVVLGPEAEQGLVDLASAHFATASEGATAPSLQTTLPRLNFIQPDRSGLPALDRYASLLMPDGSSKVVGGTDATRGCKHRCRHCPIVPVYDGQFRAVAVDVVMADIRAQVKQGAAHISFGDPDFFNGPTHARRIVEALHREFPGVTYDAIIKVEHLVAHRDLLPVLSASGCLFITSAVEAVDDEVLAKLEKGHTRADFVFAAKLCRDAGLTLVPTFVAFTPWTTVDGYMELLRIVADLDLVANVAPVQWGIRLLVTWQSRLLELPDIRSVIGAFDANTLTYPWTHPDPRVDLLQQQVMALAGVRAAQSRDAIFATVCELAQVNLFLPSRSAIPYMNEPWDC